MEVRSLQVWCFLLFLMMMTMLLASPPSSEGPWYDYTAFTECTTHPEEPLYHGGILKDKYGEIEMNRYEFEKAIPSPAFLLENLTATARYAFSCWVKLEGEDSSSLVKASLYTENSTLECIGSVLAKSACWSFLKGGFVLDSPSDASILFFQNAEKSVGEIQIASASLQPFTVEQWKMHRENSIRIRRKRVVTIHVSDAQGNRIPGATISVEQISRDFPFGSAIAKTIIGNSAYQAWFSRRFNAAVFENELKWYVTEPERHHLNYTLADQMLEFVRSNKIMTRGHNIFWEDPQYTPPWVRNLTGSDLESAVGCRINGLMSRYKGEFVHWDVSNEMLHFDFYEERLGPNASLGFFNLAHESDPSSTLFVNEFNVVETCEDVNSSVDHYIVRLKELKRGGAFLEGVGLEGHFGKPNVALVRAVLDKIWTLELPVWFTEIDISKHMDHQTQAIYLEEVLREGFSHPSINGIMLWTAIHPNGCYQMCLTDNEFHNLPTGDVVDKLLQEWQTNQISGVTNDHGLYSFNGYLGEYKISVDYDNKSVLTTLALNQGLETMHLNIQLY